MERRAPVAENGKVDVDVQVEGKQQFAEIFEGNHEGLGEKIRRGGERGVRGCGQAAAEKLLPSDESRNGQSQGGDPAGLLFQPEGEGTGGEEIIMQQTSHCRQGPDDLLGQSAEKKTPASSNEPPCEAAAAGVFAHPDLAPKKQDQRGEIKTGGENGGAAGDVGDRLGVQGMQGEQHTRQQGQPPPDAARQRARAEKSSKQGPGQQVHPKRGGGMQGDVHQVVAPHVKPADGMVEVEGEDGHRPLPPAENEIGDFIQPADPRFFQDGGDVVKMKGMLQSVSVHQNHGADDPETGKNFSHQGTGKRD